MDESPTKEGPARAWLWTAVAPTFAVFAIWMLIGSVAAGYRAADLFTLVSRALECDPDVFIYVKDVLDKLLAGCSDDHSLRPDVWKESHPEAVRTYRQDERQHRACSAAEHESTEASASRALPPRTSSRRDHRCAAVPDPPAVQRRLADP